MQTCPKMQATITEIAQHHKLNFSSRQAHLRLEQPEYLPLVIEKIGKHELTVTQYLSLNGDLIQDPEVVFLMTEDGWIPIEITQRYGGYRRVADLTSKGDAIAKANLRGIAAIAEFAELWADNLRDQGWLSL